MCNKIIAISRSEINRIEGIEIRIIKVSWKFKQQTEPAYRESRDENKSGIEEQISEECIW